MAEVLMSEPESMALKILRNKRISSMKLVHKTPVEFLVDFMSFMPLTKDFIVGYNFTVWVYDAHNFTLKKSLM